MDPQFNERQFEFAVNFELTTALGVVPVIPTTFQEAKKGWDAKFTTPGWIFHLQYKVASFASRKTGKNQAQWGFHGKTYFRFGLLENDLRVCAQHQRLVNLRAKEPAVFYCAPLFYREVDYLKWTTANTVLAGSSLLDVATLVPPTYVGPHSVTYDESGARRVWSDEGPAWSAGSRDFSARRSAPTRSLGRAALLELTDTLIDVAVQDEASLPVVPRAGRDGPRRSLLAARSPRPPGFTEDEAPPDDREMRAAAREVDPDWDRAASVEDLEALDDAQLVATLARVGALDFGITTYVEPDPSQSA